MKLKCFVIMPFGNARIDPEGAHKLELIYTQWIKPTVEAISITKGGTIECHRADKSMHPEEIVTHIIDRLVNSDIVIADLTGQNANVCYELGVRHAVHNNTILISQDLQNIPFVLRTLRIIEYHYNPESLFQFKEHLASAITAILSDTPQKNNPVRRYLCDKAVQDLISGAVPPGLDAVRSIAAELVTLRKDIEQYAKQTRQVMESVTTAHLQDDATVRSSSSSLHSFEGVWESSSGGTYCARIVDGRVFIPYCYDGDSHLTGHYYDCTVMGQTVISRFKWFDSPISGYAFYRLVSPYCVEGGWWLDHYVPEEARRDISKISTSIPGMVSVVWTKKSGRVSFPLWAEDYFKRKLYKTNKSQKTL